MISQKRRTTRCILMEGGREFLPSVMALQAKYKTPTAAVSSKVATKEPSTLALEPYEIGEKKRVSNLVTVSKLKTLNVMFTLQIIRLNRNQAS